VRRSSGGVSLALAADAAARAAGGIRRSATGVPKKPSKRHSDLRGIQDLPGRVKPGCDVRFTAERPPRIPVATSPASPWGPPRDLGCRLSVPRSSAGNDDENPAFSGSWLRSSRGRLRASAGTSAILQRKTTMKFGVYSPLTCERPWIPRAPPPAVVAGWSRAGQRTAQVPDTASHLAPLLSTAHGRRRSSRNPRHASAKGPTPCTWIISPSPMARPRKPSPSPALSPSTTTASARRRCSSRTAAAPR